MSTARLVAVPSGAQVAVYDLGGEGPPLVLAHAAGFCAPTLAPLAEALAGSFRCWGVDLRGHGATPPVASGSCSWSEQARDLADLLVELDLVGATGFGHSAGATVLLDAEARRPGLFTRLVCFEPPLWPSGPPPGLTEELMAGALRRHVRFASTADAVEHLRTRRALRALAPAVLAAYVDCGFAPGVDGDVVLSCPPEVEAATYRAGADHDGFARLGRVRAPVTLLLGAASPPLVGDLAALQAAALASATVEAVPAVGHLGPLEDPAAVARAVVATSPGGPSAARLGPAQGDARVTPRVTPRR